MIDDRDIASGAFLPIGQQVAWLEEILLANTALARVLGVLDASAMPNWYVAGGAIPQIVWNRAQGFDPNHGIDDFDVVYFDPIDLSPDGEAARQRAIVAHCAETPVRIEVVNEARTHLWYGREFGGEIAPYSCSEAAIFTFPTTASSVGVRSRSGRFDVYAPHGLGDLFGLVVRANKVLVSREIYERKCRRWKAAWPMLTVVPW